ncbi:alpha/beta hydrolase [Paenibacillus pinihumi]|uniref:alpha/beta hydrolase n=1 Tax=Paenibacillus pinihumi TaxID=669462 RepID=UPI00041A6409|nr:alpha/beta hydrolase [Paenibacillus pinihumi]
MRLLKRVLLVILSVICVIVVGILAFAATPLSACKFPDIASDVSSVGEGEAGENTASRLVTDHVRYTEASDHTQIAYRNYSPANPKAVVIFYHGSGANSGAGYQPVGIGLSEKYGIATYLPDIRGHGLSGGERGDAPSLQQIYDDVTLMIGTAHNEFPSLPVFLGGHSAGAGLIVNYINSPGHEFVNGYLFVAPDFGLKSNTIYEDNGHFATVCQKAYIAHALTFGLLKGHAIGVKYNYSEEQMESDIGLVQYNSVIMSLALNPGKPSEEVARIDRPFGLWVGAGDEVMDPNKVVKFADLAKQVRDESTAQIVPGEKHLTILEDTASLIGPWVQKFLAEK